LLTEVENNRTGTVVILAGYAEPMKHLLRADPGLPRRFPHNLDLPNYSVDQLASIVSYSAKSRFGKTLDGDELEAKVAVHIRNHHRRDMAEQNGGLAVNMVEAAVAAQANRIMEVVEQQHERGAANSVDSLLVVTDVDTERRHNGGLPHHPQPLVRTPSQSRHHDRARKKELVQRLRPDVLVAQDFGITAEMELGASDTEKAEVEAELDALVGMDNVKDFFHKMRDTAKFVEMTGKVEALGGCLHLILTGNPGTGKTTTARLVARYLKAFGILPTGTFKEVNGLHLKGQYVGQTSHHVSEIVKDALGGCLFIDEACKLTVVTCVLSYCLVQPYVSRVVVWLRSLPYTRAPMIAHLICHVAHIYGCLTTCCVQIRWCPRRAGLTSSARKSFARS